MRVIGRHNRRWLFDSGIALALAFSFASSAASAQQNSNVTGDYEGEIGTKQATLHLRNRFGPLTATMDHLDLAAPWMFATSDLRVNGNTVSFTVQYVQATFLGTISADGQRVTGTWTQKGNSLPATFTRRSFSPAPSPSAADGIWLGVLQVTAGVTTRLQVSMRSDASGHEYCIVDDLDLYTMDMECANTAVKGNEVSFDIPTGGAHWRGTISADGKTMAGDLSYFVEDGGARKMAETPLTLARRNALTPEKERKAAAYDSALPPVGAADLAQVLANDLAGALKDGELAPSTGAGVSIGVYSHGVSRIFSIGAAKADSIFEIGSITKPFTGLLLAQMAAQGKVTLDEPVRELLPAGTVVKPAGPEITLLDLGSQRSGLPPMPDNISVANLDNPYADYHSADLFSYLGRHGVANPNRASSNFESLGFGLLSVALANHAGMTYGRLIEDEITGPLGMPDTVLALSPAQQTRLLPGHDQFHGPAKPWDSDALAGAIGLRSTASDMLKFLVANLHPETIKTDPSSPAGATLPAAIRHSLQSQGELPSGMGLALGWLYQPETGNYWHNGATAAYSSYAFFNRKGDYAAVVLLNGSPGVNGSFVENLGRHISQRLAGKPALSLNH
jgi:CubicO group peptidase (beta-lactamase class C family)